MRGRITHSSPGCCGAAPTIAGLFAAFAVLAVAGAAFAQPGGREARADAAGFQDGTQYISVLPWESIDADGGGLILTFTDLRLPGNAGFDLVVTRTYNSNQPRGWVIAVGPPRIDTPTSAQWKVVRQDGGMMPLYEVALGAGIYRTTDYWQYDSTQHVLSLPSGVICKYEHVAGDKRYLTEMADAFANTISLTYESQPEGPVVHEITQSLAANETRTVTFEYDREGGVLTAQRMHYLGREWTYTWDHYPSRLSRFDPPAGGRWSYSYSNDPTPVLQTVTLPQGGTVTYTFTPFEPAQHRGITERTSGGYAIVPGDWIFDLDDYATKFVNTPSGQIRYEWAVDGTLGKTTIENGREVQWESYRWRTSSPVGVNYQYPHGPEGSKSLLEYYSVRRDRRDNVAYSTTYSYHDSDFNDYGQPFEISELGNFARTTKRTYWNGHGAIYVRGLIGSETVTNDGINDFVVSYNRTDPATRSDDPTGFVHSATVYGIKTTYERTDESHGNVTRETDAEGKWVQYGYSYGQVSEIATPSYTISRTINPDGTVASEARGPRTTSFTYDSIGRKTSDQPSVGAAVATNYANEANPGDPYIVRTRGSITIETHLDGYGRLISAVEKGNLSEDGTTVTTTRFDVLGRKSFASHPYESSEVGTAYTYDVLDRIATKTDGCLCVNCSPTELRVQGGQQTRYFYDSTWDGLTTTIDEPFKQGARRTTTQTWLGTGHPEDRRLWKVHDAEGFDTTYQYNPLGRLTGVQSPGVAARTYEYWPGTDRLHIESHPESGTTTYEYALNGKLKKRTDSLGQVLDYLYDAANRVSSVTSTADSNYNVSITYDDPRSDNRATMSNGWVSTTYEYDNGARLLKKTDHIRPALGGEALSFVTSFVPNEYDDLASVTYPTGRVVTYLYDSRRRVKAVRDGERTYASDMLYHPSGQVADYTSGNGVANAFRYEPQTYRPSTITHTRAGQTLLSLTYGYYDEGNVRSIGDSRPGMTQDFTDGYDQLDRLIAGTGPWGQVAYGYDGVGNRRTETRDGVPPTTYTYGPANVLTSLSGGRTEWFTPNAVGQTTVDGKGEYTYTPTGLMASAALTSGVWVAYGYDADNQRAFTVKSGVTHYYLHGPGGQVLSEYEQVGGELDWKLDYIYAGTRLLAAAKAAYQLGVASSRISGGRGRISSAPAGIDCGATCGAAYDPRTSVTLTAVPDERSRFDHWDGDCAGTSPTTTVVMDRDISCTASFVRTQAVLTITPATGGGVTGTPGAISCGTACSAMYEAGAVVQLAPVPQPGYLFVRWSGDGCESGAVTMDRDRTCEGVFATETVTLTIVKEDSGTGRVLDPVHRAVDCGPTCTATYERGASVTLNASSQWGSRFTGWGGACAGTQWTTNVTLTDNTTCTATFAPAVPGNAADFNGDGHADLVWRNMATGADLVWLMNAASQVGSATLPAEPDLNWQIVATADINGDGWPDLLWRNSATGDNRVWLMAAGRVGDVTVAGASATLPSVPDLNWRLSGVADFNADGRPDLMWRHRANGQNAIWLMDGVTKVGDVAVDTVSDVNWHIVGASDINGDGRPDLVWRHAVLGLDTVWLMNGTTKSGDAPIETVADTTWGIVGAADHNGDRRPDLVWRNGTTGADLMWWMTGTTHTGSESYPAMTDPNWVIRPEDPPRHDILGSGLALYANQYLVSPNGRYQLLYQTDGNLVLFQDWLTPIWWSGSGGTTTNVAYMQTDGNFVVYDGAWTPRWYSATAGNPGAYLVVEDDGEAVVRSPAGALLWSSRGYGGDGLQSLGLIGANRLGQGGAGGLAGDVDPSFGPPPILPIPSGPGFAWPLPPSPVGVTRLPSPAVAAGSVTNLGLPLALVPGSGELVEYYHLDALGSMRVVSDATGNVSRYHDYTPFGEEWPPPATHPDRRMFTGQERDVETGLDYFRARYYRADLGRFTTVDPAGFNPLKLVNPQRSNRYSYAINNPLTFVDRDGRDAIVVNFSQAGNVSGHQFGHNGIAAVSPNGSVLFSDFGPVGAGGFITDPAVNTRPLAAHVEFGSDGMPTPASLSAVAQELEALEHAPPGSVQLAYFSTSVYETAALAGWIGFSKAVWQDALWAKFVLWGRNCGNYVREGMSNLSRFVAVNQRGLSVPNLDFLYFRMFADASFKSVKATVTTEITDFRLKK